MPHISDCGSNVQIALPVAPKFTGPKQPGLPCLGGNVGGLSQASSKDEDVELKKTLQNTWDSLPQCPIDKALKQFPKPLTAL